MVSLPGTIASFARQGWDYAESFRYVPGVTRFSRLEWQVLSISVYLCTIFVLQRLMRHRKPLELRGLVFLHNSVLCIASLFVAVWLTYRLLYHLYLGVGAHGLVCARSVYDDGHMQLIFYVNMFMKVWEFLDTFLLALRKRKIAFLHAYHHAATLFLTWAQLTEHSTPQWVPIVINLWVHVAMYHYYAMSALRIKVWWKKYLTSLQICQFIVDVTVVGYAYFVFIRSGYDQKVCYGTEKAAIIGLSILFSYLLLFIRFYVSTYITKPKVKPEAKSQ